MSVFVWGLYEDMKYVDDAVVGLVEGSFPPEEIRVQLRSADGDREIPVRHKTRIGRGAAIGAAIGAFVWAIALDGSLAAACVGAAMGAACGAYAGVFWWRQEVDVPREPVSPAGEVLVGITAPEGRAREASAILHATGADRVGVSERPPERPA